GSGLGAMAGSSAEADSRQTRRAAVVTAPPNRPLAARVRMTPPRTSACRRARLRIPIGFSRGWTLPGGSGASVAASRDGALPKPVPALHRLAPRAFYGWFIAAGLACLSSVVVGIGFYGVAVFLDALTTERGFPRAQVSFATTLYFIGTGVAGSLIG